MQPLNVFELKSSASCDPIVVKEEERLISTQSPEDKERHARLIALILAAVSMVTVGTLALVTLSLAIKYESDSAFVFAADGILDSLDSIVVIWRFYDPHQTWSARKEYVGCVILGIFSFVSAIGLFVKSTLSITNPEARFHAVEDVWIVSSVDGITCLLLSGGKLYASYILRSLVVFTDGINSAVGAVMAFTAVASDVIIEKHDDAWLMDPIVGYVFTIFFALYGVWLMLPPKEQHKSAKHQSESIKEITL